MEPIIELTHVSKTFHAQNGEVEALKDISLSIEKGDIFGIIGLSGAGKSTLVRCLNLLEKPTDGEVVVNGNSLMSLSNKQLRKERQRIGMIFQHFNLLMQRTVLDNICFPLEIAGIKKSEARKRALELLEVVDLSEKAKAYPAQLSGGQKQRVAIARVLATDPEILLCDEATSALDPQTTASILDLLKDINQKFGITMVVITHQMSVIREICGHVAIIENGQLVEQGRVADIFNHPKSKVARDLIFKDRPAGSWEGDTDWNGESRQLDRLIEDKKLRIVFSENSAFEPVIANMVLKFGVPVNILRADTKNVGGVAKGEMILGLPPEAELQQQMEQYLVEKGLEIEEVTGDVDE